MRCGFSVQPWTYGKEQRLQAALRFIRTAKCVKAIYRHETAVIAIKVFPRKVVFKKAAQTARLHGFVYFTERRVYFQLVGQFFAPAAGLFIIEYALVLS